MKKLHWTMDREGLSMPIHTMQSIFRKKIAMTNMRRHSSSKKQSRDDPTPSNEELCLFEVHPSQLCKMVGCLQEAPLPTEVLPA